jgi:endo-1,4-beta-xylanase
MVVLPALIALTLFRQAEWNLLSNSTFGDGLQGWTTSSVVASGEDTDKTKFVRFNIEAKPSRAWDAQMFQKITETIPEGSAVTVRLVARSRTKSRITGIIEETGSPYTKYLSKDFDLTPTWQTYTVTGPLAKTANIQANVHVGHGVGQVDIREMSVLTTAPRAAVKTFPYEFLVNGNFNAGFGPWFVFGSAAPRATVVPISGQSFTKVARVEVNNPEGNAWDCQIGQLLEAGSSKGETVFVKAWIRSPERVKVTFVYEQNEAPHDKELYETAQTTDKWTEYSVPVVLANGFAANKSQFKLFFTGKGTVEVGPISLTNRGRAVGGSLPINLGGSAYQPDVKWRTEANARINKYRKGAMTLTILDKKGKPVPNANIQIRQTKHLFKFGTAAPATIFTSKSVEGDKFRDVVKRMFNVITFDNDLKWQDTGPEIFANKIYPSYEWLKKNGIELRGHNLVWGSTQYLPGNTMQQSKEEAWRIVEAHVTDYAIRMQGKLYLWDVVNEAVTETELWEKIGWDKFAEVYKIARRIDPDAQLCYNDYNISTNEKHRLGAIARANQIKSYGAPVDVFGDQSHLTAPGVDPRKLWAAWDEVNAKTGLPIEITELDLSTFDDAFQAAYLEDFYRAAFSHPKLQAVILWGFWQNAHWLANRGGHMVRADWTWRPSMTAIDRLINQEWRTQGTFKTDNKGQIRLSAFYGDYEITFGKTKGVISHPQSGTKYTVR